MKKVYHTDWSHLREVLPHSLKGELKLGQANCNINAKKVYCKVIYNYAFFLFCFYSGSNSYVGDVFYDELLKTEDGNITPHTPVYE